MDGDGSSSNSSTVTATGAPHTPLLGFSPSAQGDDGQSNNSIMTS
eukprot:CAMPEP_0194050760 /NCGR_PEP_ID=MMETSP0009_2-20130614/36917_1 /TAXON_ID=210454 /ORGANISM="Grammatophora oceanica, Strain CCMP 410" /LENGTH=44 /DNA_ID= /DNA_START= /DNA_END= /DNA_ORIENTATION=